MAKAELRYLISPDLADLENGRPVDPEYFCILVQALIGEQGEPGEDTFDFVVCTPSALPGIIPEKGYLAGRHYLFVHDYDYHLIRQAIEEFCDKAVGPDWSAVANILARYGAWEYEDYKEG